MTTIDKLRAEIDKRYAEYRAKMKTDDFTYYEGMADALDLFEQFLDTLEEPVSKDLEDCLELNEAAEKFARLYDNGTCDGIAQDCFIAGAEWMKAKMMEGAVEGEVCGRVYDHINVRFADEMCKVLEPKNISHIPADVSKYKVGDKVKIIVVKEEEQ